MGRKDSIGQARFTGLTGFFRLRRGVLSAEGRFIPMILLILSNFLLKMRIHSLFLPYFNLRFYTFFFDQTGRSRPAAVLV
jgi:hypothetical protein